MRQTTVTEVRDNYKIRGDTLIEVLFAISIFSLVAVGGLSIMNQGSATAQRALEITLVRNEIDSQAETLRFLNSSYIAAYQPGVDDYSSISKPAQQWLNLVKNYATTDSVSKFGSSAACPQTYTELNDLRNNSFVLDVKKAIAIPLTVDNFSPAQTFSQLYYSYDSGSNSYTTFDKSYGLWIEAIKSGDTTQANADYIDFNIRACWDSPGMYVPMTMGTIVRLYEPL